MVACEEFEKAHRQQAMVNGNFRGDFKLDAIKQITERGYFFGLSQPAEGGLGVITAIIMIVAALFEQKKVMKNIKQVADDTQNRFL